MLHLLRAPEITANTTDLVLAGWPVAENIPFAACDVIATVETAKAVVDVEADADGIIVRKLVAEGADIVAGEPIALVAGVGDTVGDVDAILREMGLGLGLGLRPAPAAVSSPVAIGNGHERAAGQRTFASPLARRLARENGLDIGDLVGSGPHGRILRRDVERVATQRPPVPAVPPAVPAAVAVPAGPAQARPADGYINTPHTKLRRAIAEQMVRSVQTTPTFSVRGSARVDRLLALRAQLNSDPRAVRISLNDLVVKAVAAAHMLVPAMNVIWTPDAIRSFDSVDLGVAVTTSGGLATPVLRGVERMPVTALATALRDFATRAATRQLKHHEIDGGTATISNLGMFGTEEFTAIINPPQSSILAVGATRREIVLRKGKPTPASVMRVTLSVDHRPIDGATAARWMAEFLGLLEQPARILA